ncbi:unnamed protein product, partial [Choristocarpus tenellus]
QEDAVLCPICKHDWLVQGGPPSGAILCRCGFRLDTGDEGLSLGHLKQQLSDTYTQHSERCRMDPCFSLINKFGVHMLWSSCEACTFSRVVL